MMHPAAKLSIKIGFIILFLIGIVLLLLKNVKPEDISHTLRLLSWPFIIEAILFCTTISLLQASRFFLLVRKSNLSVSFWQACKIFFSSQSATLLPGGEVVRGILLKIETGGKPIKVSGPVVAQAFVEILSAIFIVMIGSIAYRVLLVASLVLIGILSFLVLFIFKPLWIKKAFGFFQKVPWLKNYIEAIFNNQKEVQHILLNTHKKINRFTLSILGLGLAAHAMGGVFIFFIANELHLALPLLFSIFLYSSSVAIQGILGIIPGGLGITEGGMLGLLKLWGKSLSASIGLVMVFRLITLLFPIIIGTSLLLIFYGKYIFLHNKIKN